MIEVLVHRDLWQPIRFAARLRAALNGNTMTYKLQCGLSISTENITTPEADGWTGQHYVIRFADEKDASWFVLAVGGQIYA